MKKETTQKTLGISLCLLLLFVLWTAAVALYDVKPIGPQGTSVGFSTLNGAVHSLTGVHMGLYTITDWLGLVPLFFVLGFGLLGLKQLIQRKSLLKVDPSILALGGFYILVLAAFVFFEKVVINYRPILIEGHLEASYPSSTTLLVMCVMPTAIMQLRQRVKSPSASRWITFCLTAFTLFMVIGRLISGVHWMTDIVGGAILSAGLVTLYRGVALCTDQQSLS